MLPIKTLSNPLISIIVPVYNVEPYLRKCIDSILAQTYTNIEVILIDDGSPDNCPAICDWYAKKDSRVVVIHQANAGVSAARNAGLDIAKGEYIGFVDSDDWIEPDMYEVLYGLIQKTGTEISIISYNNDTPENICPIVRNNEIEVLSKDEAIYELLDGKKYQGHMPTKLYSRNIFTNERFSKEITICEDLAMSVHLFLKIKNVSYQEYTCYHYVSRSDSALHRFNKKYLSVQIAYDHILEVLRTGNERNYKLAKLKAVVANVSVAILAVDNNKFDKQIYAEIKNNINKVLNLTIFNMLGIKSKIWVLLFRLGRNSFMLGRKIYHQIRRK